MIRDSYKRRCYRAEDAIRKYGRKFANVEEVQAYLDRLFATKWFQKRWGRVDVTAKAKRGHWALGGNGHIQLPPWALTEVVVLHELAHCLAPRACPHDRTWCLTFLELLKRVGPQCYCEMKLSFRAKRIPFAMTQSYRIRTARECGVDHWTAPYSRYSEYGKRLAVVLASMKSDAIMKMQMRSVRAHTAFAARVQTPEECDRELASLGITPNTVNSPSSVPHEARPLGGGYEYPAPSTVVSAGM